MIYVELVRYENQSFGSQSTRELFKLIPNLFRTYRIMISRKFKFIFVCVIFAILLGRKINTLLFMSIPDANEISEEIGMTTRCIVLRIETREPIQNLQSSCLAKLNSRLS